MDLLASSLSVALAVLCQYEGLPGNVPDGKPFLACKSGIGIGYKVDGKLLFPGDDIVLVIGMDIQGNDQVCLVPVQHLEHGNGIRRGEPDGNQRVPAVKIKIPGVHHLLTDGVRRDDVDMSGKLVSLVGLFPELLCQGANPVGIGYQLMSPLRQGNGMVDPLEQKAVQSSSCLI